MDDNQIWNIFKKWDFNLLSPFFICGPSFADNNKDKKICIDSNLDHKRCKLQKFIQSIPLFKNSISLIAEELCLENKKFDIQIQEKLIAAISEFNFLFYDSDATHREAVIISWVNNNYWYLINQISKNDISEFTWIIEKRKKNFLEYKAEIEKINDHKIHTHLKDDDYEFWNKIKEKIFINKLVNNLSYMFFDKKDRIKNNIVNYKLITYSFSNNKIEIFIPVQHFFNFMICLFYKTNIFEKYNSDFERNQYKIYDIFIKKLNQINLNTISFLKNKSETKYIKFNLKILKKINVDNILSYVIFDNQKYNPKELFEYLFSYLISLNIIQKNENQEFIVNKDFEEKISNSSLLLDNVKNLKNFNINKKIDEISNLLMQTKISHLLNKKVRYWTCWKIKRENRKDRFVYSYDENNKDIEVYKKAHNFLNYFYKSFSFKNEKIPYAFAYKNGIGLKHIFEKHKNSTFFCKYDIKNFFESINHKDLINKTYTFFDRVLQKDLIKKYIKFISTKNKGLNIGFAPSPLLSNIYLYMFDQKINNFLKKMKKNENVNFVYTRYADDIVISSNHIIEEENLEKMSLEIEKELRQLKLSLNNKKSKFVNINHKNQYIKIFGTIVSLNIDKKACFKLPNSYFDKFIKNLRNKTLFGKDLKTYIQGKIAFSFYISEEKSLKFFSRLYKQKFIDRKQLINFIFKKFKNNL